MKEPQVSNVPPSNLDEHAEVEPTFVELLDGFSELSEEQNIEIRYALLRTRDDLMSHENHVLIVGMGTIFCIAICAFFAMLSIGYPFPNQSTDVVNRVVLGGLAMYFALLASLVMYLGFAHKRAIGRSVKALQKFLNASSREP